MTLQQLREQLSSNLNSINFTDVISVIDENYDFTETAFSNGETQNLSGKNNGSCKIFAFAQLHKLSEEQTLACFGDYYRVDVIQNPEGDDHQNIRNFMKTGWAGVSFERQALSSK